MRCSPTVQARAISSWLISTLSRHPATAAFPKCRWFEADLEPWYAEMGPEQVEEFRKKKNQISLDEQRQRQQSLHSGHRFNLCRTFACGPKLPCRNRPVAAFHFIGQSYSAAFALLNQVQGAAISARH